MKCELIGTVEVQCKNCWYFGEDGICGNTSSEWKKPSPEKTRNCLCFEEEE